MFQNFTVTTAPETGPPRVAALRAAMADAGVHGFLVPRADAHQGETVAPRDARLPWLSGFTGSAGMAVVLADRAALFVDGRYTLQAAAQVDGTTFEHRAIPADTPAAYVAEGLGDGQVLAYDPWLMTRATVEGLEKALKPKGIVLRPTENLVDTVWTDQPAAPRGPAQIHDAALAGRSAADKRVLVAQTLSEADVTATVLTLPDSIAWLLNLRGSDIARTPVVHAFAVLHVDGSVDLYVDPAKLSDPVRAHLGPDVRCHAPDAFADGLADLTGPVAVDRTSAPIAVSQALHAAGVTITWMRDPCVLPKACKTDAELAGMRTAHLRDGAAMAEFLCWLDTASRAGGLTEIDVVRTLEGLRRDTGALRDISFETISGAGPNGAIVHYRVTEDSNRTITPGDLLLVDSGAQYADGTTDITRTLSTGPVDSSAARAFTLVLKGMIAISRARWPEGLAGRDLDALARIALWQAGLDYDHGTGHGVGAYLDVHEGPQGLSRRSTEPLRPGMILSNEPGYYEAGAFGIRIENLVIVAPGTVPQGGTREMLGFETLTLAPIDRRLILPDLLTAAERDWLDGYHADVLGALGDRVRPPTALWLEKACAPL